MGAIRPHHGDPDDAPDLAPLGGSMIISGPGYDATSSADGVHHSPTSAVERSAGHGRDGRADPAMDRPRVADRIGARASGTIELDARSGLPSFMPFQPASPFAGLPIHRVVIVRAPDGGQLRGCITGTKRIGTVGYPSAKMRCVRYAEGQTEDARLIGEEVDPGVVHGISQFCRIEALIGDSWHRAVVDGATLYSDGRRAVIDCKRDWAGFRSPRNAKQSFLVELAAEALGWDYERYVLHHAGDPTRRANVDAVEAARFVPVPPHLVAMAADALATGPMPLGDLDALLHSDAATGRSRSYALMVKRVVEIDLSRRLGPRSECRAVPPLPAWLPSLGH